MAKKIRKTVYDRLATSAGIQRKPADVMLKNNRRLYNKKHQYDDGTEDQDFSEYFANYLRDGASTVKNAVKKNKLVSGEIAATGVLGQVAHAKAETANEEEEETKKRNIEAEQAKQAENDAEVEEANKSTKRVTRSGEVYSPKRK